MQKVKDFWGIKWNGQAMEIPDDLNVDCKFNEILASLMKQSGHEYICFTCTKDVGPLGDAKSIDNKTFVEYSLSKVEPIVDGNPTLLPAHFPNLNEIELVAIKKFTKVFGKDALSTSRRVKYIRICLDCFSNYDYWGDLKYAKMRIDFAHSSYLKEVKLPVVHKDFGMVKLRARHIVTKEEIKLKGIDDHLIIKSLMGQIMSKEVGIAELTHNEGINVNKSRAIDTTSKYIFMSVNGHFDFGEKAKEFIISLIDSLVLEMGTINISLNKHLVYEKERRYKEVLGKIDYLVSALNTLRTYNGSRSKDIFNPLYMFFLSKNGEKKLVYGFSTTKIIKSLLDFLNMELVDIEYKDHKIPNVHETMLVSHRFNFPEKEKVKEL